MNENDDTTHAPQTLTFEALSYLADQPSVTESDEPQTLDTHANELTTTTITDTDKVTHENHHESNANTGVDHTDVLNSSSSSTLKHIHSENVVETVNKPEHSISNGIHSDHEFDNDEIQQKMSGVIDNIRVGSDGDKKASRKSVISTHLQEDQTDHSTLHVADPTVESDSISKTPTPGPTETIDDSPMSTERQSPSLHQPIETEQHDQQHILESMPTDTFVDVDRSADEHQSQKDIVTSHVSDDDSFMKTETNHDDHQRTSSATDRNILDETTAFPVSSPGAPSSRVQSATSKRSVHITPDESSGSSNGQHNHVKSSDLPTHIGNDTDPVVQEIAVVARRPSEATSPIQRPRSPTPNDSRKASMSIDPLSPMLSEQVSSPTNDDNHAISPNLDNNISYSPMHQSDNQDDEEQKQNHFEVPTTTISPASRRESTTKDEQQKSSRPTSALKTRLDVNGTEPSTSRPSSSRPNNFLATNEQSRLISVGEQLQIPTDDFDNERMHSPPPSPVDSPTVPLIIPRPASSSVHKEPVHSRPPSELKRKSSTHSVSDHEKFVASEIPTVDGSTDNNVDHEPIIISHSKSSSRRESQDIEQIQPVPSSRRASGSQKQGDSEIHTGEKMGSRRTSNVPLEPLSHGETHLTAQQSGSRRESTEDVGGKSSSRPGSVTSEHQPFRKRTSTAEENQTSSRRESTHDAPQVSSKRGSIALEQKTPSRKASTASEQQLPSKRTSISSEREVSGELESSTNEAKLISRKGSTASEKRAPSEHASTSHEPQVSSRRESAHEEVQASSKRGSTVIEKNMLSRKGSTTSENELIPKKRASVTVAEQPASRRESSTDASHMFNAIETNALEPNISSRKSSTASENPPSSKRASFIQERRISNEHASTGDEHNLITRKRSTDSQKPPSKRNSLTEGQQSFSQHENGYLENSSDFHQDKLSSRRESQQPVPSSRRTSTNKDNQSSSTRRSSAANSTASRELSHPNSFNKQESQSFSIIPTKTSYSSSLKPPSANHHLEEGDANDSHIEHGAPGTEFHGRVPSKHKKEHLSPVDKRQKSSSTVDSNGKRPSSFQQRSAEQSKRNSLIVTENTIVQPLIMDSSNNVRQHSGNLKSQIDSDREYKSELPPVNGLLLPKSHPSSTSKKSRKSILNRSEGHLMSSSHASTPTDDESMQKHWTKHIPVPSIHLTDDEQRSSREDHIRPQSPNVGQIAERNQQPSPKVVEIRPIVKKSTDTDTQKRKEPIRVSRRSNSVDSLTNIRMVDDKSLDSTSDNNTDFEQQRRRHIRPRKKDVETNTESMYDTYQQKQQRSFFDERELTPLKPLKATKPISDHLNTTRRRAPNNEDFLTTPDTIPNADTPTIRRTVKKTKDQDKEPVNVNVTVVIKKFAGTNSDGTPHTTTETFVEQKPSAYFEPVPHPVETQALSRQTDDKDMHEETIERPKTTDQQPVQAAEPIIESDDRQTQSDTEQIITEKKKKQRRPKRISRTCQTYECVFRRMEREQMQDLRVTNDTEKNIQTMKSQLRPRKKSPKKNFPLYLSADTFRVEELLPKPYHQSRRNASKSSSIVRSLSPQGGKLLILRPTLPFHHTDAVNVQRVCLQYAIDLIPNENPGSANMSNRNKLTVLKQPEQTNSLPMISSSSSAINFPSNKSHPKEKSASYKSEEFPHQRKTGGGV